MPIPFTPWRANGGVVLDSRGYMVADCDSTNDQKGARAKAIAIAQAPRMVQMLLNAQANGGQIADLDDLARLLQAAGEPAP